MNTLPRWLPAIVLLAVGSSGSPAAPPDVAELFPATTLAYAEAREPGKVADAAAALFAGGPVADSLKFTHDKLDRAQFPQLAPGVHRSSVLNLLATPEFVAESKRFHGVGAGLLGFSERGQPRFAAAALLGDSHAAGLAVRMFLTTSPTLRRVAVHDGVPVFQHRGFTGPVLGNDGQPLPAEEEQVEAKVDVKPKDAKPDERKPKEPKPNVASEAVDELTYAYTPGLFVVGSDTTAVAEVLTRFAGKTPVASLAASDQFKKSQPTRDRGGVFVFAVPPVLVARMDAARRSSDGSVVDPPVVAFLKFAVNAKAVPSLAGNLAVEKDALALRFDIETDTTANSPVRDLLAGVAIVPETVRFVGSKPMWSVSFTTPTGEARAKAILDLLDARAKTTGILGKLPSEAVAEADKTEGAKIAELLAGIGAITVLTPIKPELPKDAVAVPMLVLHAESDAVAEKWEAAVPKLLALASGSTARITPSSEMIGPVRVLSVAAPGLPGGGPIHVARSGRVVVFGQDRKLVVEATQGKGTAPVVGGEAVNTVALLTFDLAAMLAPTGAATPTAPEAVPATAPVARFGRRPRAVYQPPQPGQALPLGNGLAAALREWPNVVGTVARRERTFVVELRLPDAKKAVPASWVRFLEWVEKQPRDPNAPRPQAYDGLSNTIFPQ